MPDPKSKATAADDAAAAELLKLTRDDLNEAAADAGVPNPDELPNKEAVIDAIEAPNPALAPIPEPEPGEQTYKVIGPHRVHDTNPGGTFAADIAAPQLALLIESGHIELLNSEG